MGLMGQLRPIVLIGFIKLMGLIGLMGLISLIGPIGLIELHYSNESLLSLFFNSSASDFLIPSLMVHVLS